jgi:hypothetical protein
MPADLPQLPPAICIFFEVGIPWNAWNSVFPRSITSQPGRPVNLGWKKHPFNTKGVTIVEAKQRQTIIEYGEQLLIDQRVFFWIRVDIRHWKTWTSISDSPSSSHKNKNPFANILALFFPISSCNPFNYGVSSWYFPYILFWVFPILPGSLQLGCASHEVPLRIRGL